MKNGFTLIETLIYIALFSIIMMSGFVTAFQIIQGASSLDIKTTEAEEGQFLLKKIEWALTGISTSTDDIASPSIVVPNATSSLLSVQKYQAGIKTRVEIRLNSANNTVEMREGSGEFLPITTENIEVSSLSFQFIPSNDSAPAGIAAVATVDGGDISITKFLPQ